MTTSHAANRNASSSATPALGWACALLLGLMMAGLLLCAALFISSRRDAQNSGGPLSEFNTVQAGAAAADGPAQPDAPVRADELKTPAGSAD